MAYFLTMLYIAIIFVRPQEWFDFMRGWPILDVMAVMCIAMAFLEGEFSADKFRRSTLNKLVLWFWAALVLSQLTNFNYWYTRMAVETFAKVVIVYFLIIFTVTTLKRLKMFVWLLVFLATFLAIQSVGQYYAGYSLGEVGLLERGEVVQTRGLGIFQDPNDLALNLLSFLPFVLPTFHKAFLSPTWVSSLPFLVVMVMGMVFTRSRGGMVGLAGVLWFYFHRRVGFILSLGALMLLVSLLLTIPRMESLKAPGDASTRSRLTHWSRGLTVFKNHPVFGVGKGWFRKDYHQTAHNSFVLVLSEAGIIGAFLWVGLFFEGFRTIFTLKRMANPPPWLPAFLNALQGALLGWLISGFFLSRSYKFTPYILLALVVAGLHALREQGYDLSFGWSLREARNAFLCTLASIAGVYVLLNILWRTLG